MKIGYCDWSKTSAYDAVFRVLGSGYDISELDY